MNSDVLQKINLKLISIHIFAGLLLVFAVSLIGYINDIELANIVEKNGVNEAMKQLGPERLSNYSIWFYIAPLLGLLLSTLVSVVFFIKTKSFWFYGLFVFIALLMTNYFGLYQIENTKYIVYLLEFGLVINVIISSAFLIIIAFTLYFISYKISKNI